MNRDHEAWDNPRLYLPVYRFTDAARLAQTTPQTVARWYRGYSVPGHQMRRVFPAQESKLLSYLQLIEVSVAATFRRFGVKLEELRRAHEYLRGAFDGDYPFAQLKMKTDGYNVLAELLSDPRVLVVANQNGQFVWTDIIQERLAQFDYEQGLAMRWFPRGHSHPILIDPRISFGAPVVAGTGIPTAILKGRHIGGESVEILADDYGLTLEQVNEALFFEETLKAA